MKLLLLGSYHGNNKGDETIFYSFLERIKMILSEAEITITTNRGVYFEQNYNVKTIKPASVLFKIHTFDLIILGGGGPLFDYSLMDTLKINKKSQLLYWLSISYIGKLLGKSVIWIAIGVGPIATIFSKMSVKYIAQKVDFISVRDRKSLMLLKDLGIDNVIESRDIVFGLDIDKWKDPECFSDNSVLIIPRYWKEEDSLLKDRFSKIIEKLLKKGERVILSGTNYRTDGDFTDKLNEEFKDNPNYKYFPLLAHDDLKKFFGLISKSKIIITMRMHPVIIGSLFGIPSVVIEHKTPKLKEVMKNLGIDDASFYLEEGLLVDSVVSMATESVDILKSNVPKYVGQNIEIEKNNTKILEKYLRYGK